VGIDPNNISYLNRESIIVPEEKFTDEGYIEENEDFYEIHPELKQI